MGYTLPFLIWRRSAKKAPVLPGTCRTRTGALKLPWYHLASPRPCGHSLCRTQLRQRGNGRTRRRLTVRPRGSETMFCAARPARFHPSGFLSGADDAYSSLHSQFDTIYIVMLIIRKNSGFVNKNVKKEPSQSKPAGFDSSPEGRAFEILRHTQKSSPIGGAVERMRD